MKIPMKVHSAESGKVTVDAKLMPDGSPISATVNGLAVQLTSDTHGTWALRFHGGDLDAAKALFVAGETVNVEISK